MRLTSAPLYPTTPTNSLLSKSRLMSHIVLIWLSFAFAESTNCFQASWTWPTFPSSMMRTRNTSVNADEKIVVGSKSVLYSCILGSEPDDSGFALTAKVLKSLLLRKSDKLFSFSHSVFLSISGNIWDAKYRNLFRGLVLAPRDRYRHHFHWWSCLSILLHC